MNKCGCGRSPTGFCIGWHSLTKEEYEIKLHEHNARFEVTEQEEEAWQEMSKKQR